MYLGKYPDSTELPPGYRGVALTPATSTGCECEEKREEKCEEKRENHGFFDRFLSHHLDFEDLLLIALILMLLWSGADLECILMLVLLFILGL